MILNEVPVQRRNVPRFAPVEMDGPTQLLDGGEDMLPPAPHPNKKPLDPFAPTLVLGEDNGF